MIYKNNTFNVPTTEEIITSLCHHNIDIILIGSEAGKLYNLCDSVKDIDFMINTSEENMKKMFVYLQQFFPIKNYQEFFELDRIVLRSLDRKPIEFIKKSNFVTFESIISNTETFEYYNNQIRVINIHNYIEYIKKFKSYLQENLSNYKNKDKIIKKIHKYTTLINNYNQLDFTNV